MKILYFAWLRSKVGQSEETISLPDDVTTLYQLITWLKTRGPAYEEIFTDLNVVRVAIDQEHITGDTTLEGASEVAFFPPVTGG
ncbi:MAG: molybdopterin converting factor subunit 1 [Sneathiella sp.]|nr:molybdopterin converting factor subunit 1 [Sneathiella sp.]